MMPPDTAVVANCPNFDQDGPISCGARNPAVLRFNTPIMRTCVGQRTNRLAGLGSYVRIISMSA